VSATTPPQQSALLASQQQQSFGDYLSASIRRIRGGDLGSLPIILGFVVIAVIFQSQNANFLSPRNIVQLILQMAGIASIAYGVVFVLLLGEIDLSASYVSAVAGVSVALLLRPPYELPWFVALAIAFGAMLAIGALHGWIITFFQLPSFVVTLAGFLAWSGVVLGLIGGAGTVIIGDPVIRGISLSFFPREVGWAIGIGLIVLYAAGQFLSYRNRAAKGLANKPLGIIALETVILAVLTLGIVYVCNLDRGLPFVGIILLVALFVLTYIAQSTRLGRYIYAIGGNKEAARRAGIRVESIRIIVFMISSVMAGVGGIILASRLGSVATNAGGGDLLLNSIAAAVIGGTSLFGGRGKVSSAILGALIVASIDNGLGLIPGLPSSIKFIITGLVLLAAVIIDSLSRRSQQKAGLR
jgi:D-xylose transport system permease protein